MSAILNKKPWPLYMLSVFCMLLLATAGCTKMDDYKKDFVKGDLIYPAKPDTVMIYSGDYRVLLKSVLTSDPNIIKSHIYWDSRTDSLEVNVHRSGTSDTISLIVNKLLEGSHTFEVVNEDAGGNRSVPVFAVGVAYGDKYLASLNNRPIESSFLDTALQVHLRFADIDLSAGPILTEIHYLKSDNDSAKIFMDVAATDTLLQDYKKGSSIIYRTYFRPDSVSIDTFKTVFDTYTPQIQDVWVDLTAKYLLNAGNPFYYSIWDGGRWGDLDQWTTTSNVKNAGGYGGYEVKNHSMIAMEAGWGKSAITNGKIYQSVYLPYSGKWRMTVNMNDLNDQGKKYIVAAQGKAFPDIEHVEDQSIANYEFSPNHGGDDISITFTIDTPGYVTLGFLANMTDNGSFFEVNYLKLEYNYNN